MSSGLHRLDAAATERAAYVHIPFCRRRCPYCDFAVVDLTATSPDVDRYVAAVLTEIDMEPEWKPLHAVNFGGGTPSALKPSQLARLLEKLADRFGLVADAEVSLEANPEDWTEEYAVAIADAGFNRVSLGVQSFDADTLGYLGRRHSPRQALDAFEAGRRVGIESINVDLIFGSPGETTDVWEKTVRTVLDLEPDHVSIYALTVELGTALSRAVAAGAAAPDDDDQADKYEYFATAAAGRGLVQYEISNWARPGHECRYNLTTWAHGEYIAFGVGAHGNRNGVRTRNVRRLDRYMESIGSGRRPIAGTEALQGWETERERIFVGLRRIAGVTAGDFGRQFLESPTGRRLRETGVVADVEDRIVVVNPLLADAVAREVLGFSPAV